MKVKMEKVFWKSRRWQEMEREMTQNQRKWGNGQKNFSGAAAPEPPQVL